MELSYDDNERESRLSTSEDAVDDNTISAHVSSNKIDNFE